ncbi:MAG: hypothetical protein PHH48_06415 [Eubacteriales bacterium]|nr:hypothetical protein [Eubacteriales bacterium]
MDYMTMCGSFCGGFVAGIAGLYAYAKAKGILNIQADYAKLDNEVKRAIGNISIEEVGAIFAYGRKCLKDDGKITVADAQKIGILVIEAMKG